jgi:hypothetical protein
MKIISEQQQYEVLLRIAIALEDIAKAVLPPIVEQVMPNPDLSVIELAEGEIPGKEEDERKKREDFVEAGDDSY